MKMAIRSETLDSLVQSKAKFEMRAYCPRSELELQETIMISRDDLGVVVNGRRNWKGEVREAKNYFIPYGAVANIVLPDDLSSFQENMPRTTPEIKYDPVAGVLSYGGKRVVLGQKQAAYMTLLMDSRGEFVEIQKFRDITSQRNPENRTVNISTRMTIAGINAKLKDLGLRIVNSPKLGYCLTIAGGEKNEQCRTYGKN